MAGITPSCQVLASRLRLAVKIHWVAVAVVLQMFSLFIYTFLYIDAIIKYMYIRCLFLYFGCEFFILNINIKEMSPV